MIIDRPIHVGRGRQRAANVNSDIWKDMHSMTIRHYKRQARARAAKNGTSHQAELNAIAIENGHSSWGSFQASITEVASSVSDADAAADMPSGTVFRSVDDGIRVELDWNVPMDRRDDDWKRIPFMPAFNVLGPKFLPDAGSDRDRHVDRISSILIPESTQGMKYFDDKGRETLTGFLHMEIGRAGREDRAPSIPAMIDWIADGLRWSSRENERRRTEGIDAEIDRIVNGVNDGFHGISSTTMDAMHDWLRSIEKECMEHAYAPHTVRAIRPLTSMTSREMHGILGTMDRGLLPFKNMRIRRATS